MIIEVHSLCHTATDFSNGFFFSVWLTVVEYPLSFKIHGDRRRSNL